MFDTNQSAQDGADIGRTRLANDLQTKQRGENSRLQESVNSISHTNHYIEVTVEDHDIQLNGEGASDDELTRSNALNDQDWGREDKDAQKPNELDMD